MPLGAAAQPYTPPPSDFTKFWEEPAFSRYKPRGPAQAHGLILYSHGERGANIPSWDAVPESYLQDFAVAGWDIIKINRNHLHRIPQDTAADYVVERALRARAEGYRKVIAAGQSYGGAVAVVAGAKSDSIWGVVSTAPGFASEGCGATAWSGQTRLSESSLERVAEELARTKARKVILSMAAGDECYPFTTASWFDGVRAKLGRTGARFVFLDRSMPIYGHGVAGTAQFRAWYAQCLVAFLNDEPEAAAGEARCSGPQPSPRYLFPADFRTPSFDAGTVVPGRLLGAWSGEIKVDLERVKASSFKAAGPASRDVCIVVIGEQPGEVRAMIVLGAGAEQRLSMASYVLTLKRSAAAYEYVWPTKHLMALAPRESVLGFSYFDTTLRWEGELKPGCRVY